MTLSTFFCRAAAGLTLAWAAPAGAQGVPVFDRSIELASFDTAWTRVRDSYYDKSLRGLDWNRLRDSLRPIVAEATSRADTRRAISSLLSRLGESHFGVIPGDAMAVSAPTAAGLAGDAGIEVRFLDSILVITRVESGTAAFEAGVRPGWLVDAIDTLRVLDAWRTTRAVTAPAARRFSLVRLTLTLNSLLRGPAGGSIRLSVRDDKDVRRDVAVGLRETPGQLVEFGALPPVLVRFESHRVARGEGCLGVIRFNMFMTPVVPRFQDAMADLAGCEGITLDLRGNLGGLGAMIVGMSGYFFAEPETLGTMHLRDATMRYVANPVRVNRRGEAITPYAGPVAIVVDELSASTTEILAAAMQHLGRARVFGVQSASQALPAVVMRLPNGDRFMYVIADFVGPGGSRVEGTGVVPDQHVPLDQSSLLAGRDEALEAALAWLRARRPTLQPG
ncbi:MAG TPA: S41 family peptidase [Gemmatimonadaceae bacterium]